MKLTHAGLFEGYGGTTMAAAAVLGEIDTRWYSDIKPASQTLMEHRHPKLPNLGDMTAVTWSDVEPVDVLTASWPCQPHSSAGRRLGEADPRALWPHVARAVDELRPRVFLGENVARITSNGELRRVARSLADLGYVGAWRCGNASDVGAPHRRSRCFVVAVREDLAAANSFAAGRPAGSGLGGSAGTAALGNDHAASAAGLKLLKTPTADLATNGGTQHPDKRKAGRHGPTLADEVEWLSPIVDWREYEAAIRRWETTLGRSAPAPTTPGLRAPHRPQLSAAFAEWMMGLPAGWVTDVPGLTRGQQLSLLGDGVVPQQGAAAFGPLLDHLLGIGASEAAA